MMMRVVIFADKRSVIGETDDGIEPLDLIDRGLNTLARLLIDDVKDVFEKAAGSVCLRPASEFGSDWIHHLDAAFDVAGDNAVADGGESCAKLLLGLEDLFGSASENFERCAVCGGDRMEAAAHKETNKDSHAKGNGDERLKHVAHLAAPLADSNAPSCLGVLGDGVDVLTNLVHQGLAVKVQVDIVGLSSGTYRWR